METVASSVAVALGIIIFLFVYADETISPFTVITGARYSTIETIRSTSSLNPAESVTLYLITYSPMVVPA